MNILYKGITKSLKFSVLISIRKLLKQVTPNSSRYIHLYHDLTSIVCFMHQNKLMELNSWLLDMTKLLADSLRPLASGIFMS